MCFKYFVQNNVLHQCLKGVQERGWVSATIWWGGLGDGMCVPLPTGNGSGEG